jgi:hypothetical protein
MFYRSWGVTIDSFLDLPGLPGGEAPADIIVRCQKFQRRRSHDPQRFADSETVDISWSHVGRFLITDRSITVRPEDGAEESLLQLYVLGPALSVLLHLRGMFVLHASAIEIDGKAVSFAGESGSGKSSLASALHLRGYPVLADDVVILGNVHGRWNVWPGTPTLRLWPDTIRALGRAVPSMEHIHTRSQKRVWRLARKAEARSRPARCIYVLGVGRIMKVENASPKQAFLDFMRNAYCRSLAKPSDAAFYFLHCTRLARDVPLRYLYRTRSLSTIERLADLVEQDQRTNSIV